ncbi:class A beta-lactamase-related serine hydrolase [Aerococcaceae bacterium DSM 111020]|nr:class A beta-lactamase-related serine hydrolase [Aerococcaceae bacterium DSM 111020]
MEKKTSLIVGGILVLIVLNIFLITKFFVQPSDGLLNFSNNTPSEVMKPRNVNLLPEGTILVDSMVKDYVETGVANRSDVPLLTQISANNYRPVDEDSPVLELDVLPWFYGSPEVEPVSDRSLAQKKPLIREESLNGFSWHQQGDQIVLYQFDRPFTGFHATRFGGWNYFVDGMMQEYYIPLKSTKEWVQNRKIMTDLVPIVRPNYIFVEPAGNYAQLIDIKPVSYSILYKDTDNLILTAPPLTKDSRLLTTTKDFFEIPMDVVEEVTTFEGTWLHVYIGYDELGWIKKDESGAEYVRAYYSERELLDIIQQVLKEELSTIDARVGASFVNNETMSQISVNNQIFFPASTQKIYVLGELYHQYATGELDPYQSTRVMYDADKVPGAGIISGYAAGTVFTLDELVDLVVVYSDNTAANMLIDAVGGGEVINPHIHQMGLYDTYVTGKYYGGDTYFTTTPEDAARYFALLYNNQVNGEPYDEQLISKFSMNTHNFLRNYIGGATTSWNKSGLGGTEQNDVATFVTPYGSYSLAVYTAEPLYYGAISDQVGTLSLRVHDVFNEIRSQLWMTYEGPIEEEPVENEEEYDEQADTNYEY